MWNALKLASTHLDKAAFVYQLAESTSFYIQNQNPQLYEKLVKIRTIFNYTSAGLGALCFAQLFYQIALRWSFSSKLINFLATNDVRISFLFMMATGAAYFKVAELIATKVNQLFKPKENLQNYLPMPRLDTKVEWTRSSNQAFTQNILCARTLLNISLACLTPTPYFLITTIFLQLASFITTARWKILKYERTFTTFYQGPIPQEDGQQAFVKGVDPRIQKVIISYFRPMLSALNQKNEECYCGDTELETDMSQVCSNHAAHTSCIVGSIYTAMEKFSNPTLFFWQHFIPRGAREYLNQRREITQVVYQININRKALPSCPTCRNQPGYGELEVQIEDIAVPGELTPAKVTLIDTNP